MKVANPSLSHSSVQSLAPRTKPNHACDISCAIRDDILPSPHSIDGDRNIKFGLKRGRGYVKIT